MRKQQRLLAMLVTFLLLCSSFPLSMFAEEAPDSYEGMINIQSEWQGSVFGDVGGKTRLLRPTLALRRTRMDQQHCEARTIEVKYRAARKVSLITLKKLIQVLILS